MPKVCVVGGMGEGIGNVITENLKRSHREIGTFEGSIIRDPVESQKG